MSGGVERAPLTGLLYDEVCAEAGSHVATRRLLHAAELQAQVKRIQDNKDAANEAIIQAELVQDLRVSRFAGPPTLNYTREALECADAVVVVAAASPRFALR